MEAARQLERPRQLGAGHLRLLTCPRRAGRLEQRLELIGELLLGTLEHLEARRYSLGDLSVTQVRGDKGPEIYPFPRVGGDRDGPPSLPAPQRPA